MAQRNGLIRETVTGIAAEGTSGTHGGTLTRVHLVQGSLLGSGFARTTIEVPTESPSRYANQAHLVGAPVAGWGPLTWQLCRVPDAQRLVAAVIPSMLSHDLLWQHAYGRRYAAAGTAVTGSGSTTTSVDLVSATGRKVGELVMIGAEVRRITAITSNTITVSPALSGAPAAAVVVRGLRTFVLPETRTGTLTIEQEHVQDGGAAEQYRVLGAMGSLSLTFPKFNEIPTAALAGQGTAFVGPDTLSSPSWSLGHAPGDSDMGLPLAWTPQVFLDGAAYRTEVDGFKVEISQQIDAIPDGSKPTGIGGWLDTGGRDGGISVRGSFRVRLDPDRVTAFDAGTLHHLLIACDPLAGVATTGGAFWECSRVQVIGRPVPIEIGKGRIGYDVMWKALHGTDTPSGSSAEEMDLARSPVRFGLT
jgi:hypothetical protein